MTMSITVDTEAGTARPRIIAAISDALAQVLDTELPELTEETQLFDQIGLDSTGVLELLMLLEDTLEIEVDADGIEMSNFHSVGSLADFVTAEMAA
jgi:acyl carrier protein